MQPKSCIELSPCSAFALGHEQSEQGRESPDAAGHSSALCTEAPPLTTRRTTWGATELTTSVTRPLVPQILPTTAALMPLRRCTKVTRGAIGNTCRCQGEQKPKQWSSSTAFVDPHMTTAKSTAPTTFRKRTGPMFFLQQHTHEQQRRNAPRVHAARPRRRNERTMTQVHFSASTQFGAHRIRPQPRGG